MSISYTENFKDIGHLNIVLSGEVFEQPNK